MTSWKIYTPEGVQDILFEECYVKRIIEEKLRNLFRTYGYNEVETPSLEFYDTFSAVSDIAPQEAMFKFFDPQGRILVLRPDITIPIARTAATKLKDEQSPIKFSYIGNVFRYNELGGGKQKEFTQAGVEILGIDSPEADAEIIATAINSIKALGIENFQLDIGQVEFFKGIMEEAKLSVQDMELVRTLIDRKDFLGIEEIIREHDIDDKLKEVILNLPGLFGSMEVIEKAEKLTSNSRSLAALQNLRNIYSILEDYSLEKYVSIDLGMVQSLNYYTGIIFRGFTYGVGFPVISGGRYDKLVEAFGMKSPATGFSLGINLVMMALDRQKINYKMHGTDSLVCYSNHGRRAAYGLSQELRKQGLVIEMDIACRDLEKAKEYARAKSIGGIIYITDESGIELHNIKTGEVTRTSVDELLNK
ncbi:MAG: ATP phosphoribosyltransferase regulatory subunit [Bacillota bacterium]|nr:ATP phosphoribosyltransferase regulatory subunit [Bacillota bacterium]